MPKNHGEMSGEAHGEYGEPEEAGGELSYLAAICDVPPLPSFALLLYLFRPISMSIAMTSSAQRPAREG